MTSEQLQNVRAERWRQKSNPVLTAEDARAWVDGVGLCLFLPRRGNFPAAAPSFVEAVMGAPSEVAGREAIENATGLMRRLAADAAVVPLNLFAEVASDQPDFLASRATLPYVFSLIGGRNWKSGPGMKASVLMTDVWALLKDGEARTAGEIQNELGRELTEAAVLRALAELWHGLRAIPVYDGATARDGAAVTRWELTQTRFAAEMTESQKVAQPTALSALVSLYLEAAVAASSEEIETFLSPLTARSRAREVVNGLMATRQLGLVSVGAQPLLHVAGSLPEFEEEEAAKPEPRRAREGGAERKPYERTARPFPERAEGREPRKRQARPFGERGGERRERPAARAGEFPKRRYGAEQERPRRDQRERTGPPRERTGPTREGRSFGKPGAERFGGKAGEGRPGEWKRRERPQGAGEWKKRERPQGGGEWKKRERPAKTFRPRGPEQEGAGGRRERRGGEEGKFPPRKFTPRSGAGGERKKFGAGGERPWQDRGQRSVPGEGKREFRPRREGERPAKFGGKKFDGRKFEERGKRPFFRERPKEGDAAPERRGGPPREGGWKPRPPAGGKPGFKSGGKGTFRGEGRPAFRSEGKPGFKGPAKPYGKSGKPEFKKTAGPFRKSGKPGVGRASKPFGKSAKPGFGKPRQGGFKPPFRKRKKEGDGGGE